MKRVRTLLVVVGLLFLSHTATAQGLPNDCKQKGLYGRVHLVEESNIGKRMIPDTIHRKVTRWVNVPDTQRVFLFFKKVRMKRERRDSIIVERTTNQVPDTHYYSHTEYTPEGYLKNRLLVRGGTFHEITTVTYLNKHKVEMRVYCKESDETMQWHYVYSGNGNESVLEQVYVTKFRGHESGEFVERIEYEYVDEGATCIERHIDGNGKMVRRTEFFRGLLSREEFVGDSIVVYDYDAKGRVSVKDVYNTTYMPIHTITYEYNSPYVTIIENKNGKSKTEKFIEDCDGYGNWIQRTDLNRKTSYVRNIGYVETSNETN